MSIINGIYTTRAYRLLKQIQLQIQALEFIPFDKVEIQDSILPAKLVNRACYISRESLKSTQGSDGRLDWEMVVSLLCSFKAGPDGIYDEPDLYLPAIMRTIDLNDQITRGEQNSTLRAIGFDKIWGREIIVEGYPDKDQGSPVLAKVSFTIRWHDDEDTLTATDKIFNLTTGVMTCIISTNTGQTNRMIDVKNFRGPSAHSQIVINGFTYTVLSAEDDGGALTITFDLTTAAATTASGNYFLYLPIYSTKLINAFGDPIPAFKITGFVSAA